MIQIVMSGVGGALGALVGLGLLRLLGRRGSAWMLVLCIAPGVAGSQLLGDYGQSWARAREAERLFAADPLFRAVVTDYPEMKERLRESLVRGGSDAERARRDLLGTVFKKYVAKAPDEPVIEFVRATVRVLNGLEHDPDACYGFLFPGVAPHPRPLGKEDAATVYAAMAKVVESGHGVAVAPPAMDGSTFNAEVQMRLAERYGDDATVLQDPTTPGVDRRLVCRMSISFYEELLQLPPERVGGVIRWLLGERERENVA